MAASSAWRPLGPLVLIAAAAVAGGCLGLLVAALAPSRFTAVELLLVAPPPGQHQSAVQTRYAAGIQRVVGGLADVRAGRQVRMVVTPDLPLIEIDATAGSRGGPGRRRGDHRRGGVAGSDRRRRAAAGPDAAGGGESAAHLAERRGGRPRRRRPGRDGGHRGRRRRRPLAATCQS
jgi:hypothetical protein